MTKEERLLERLRAAPPNTAPHEAADALERKDAILKQALFALEGADSIDTDMAIAIHAITKELT